MEIETETSDETIIRDRMPGRGLHRIAGRLIGSAAAQTATDQASQVTAMISTQTAKAGAAIRRFIGPAEARALWDDPQIKTTRNEMENAWDFETPDRVPGFGPLPRTTYASILRADQRDRVRPSQRSSTQLTTLNRRRRNDPHRQSRRRARRHTAAAAVLDFATIKSRQQAAWSSGDYAVVGTTLQIVGEQLCETLDLRSGQSVLDVAAGNGNVTLAAARRGGEVTSTDYVPALLERGRARAAAEGFSIVMQEADAEALPFAEARSMSWYRPSASCSRRTRTRPRPS